MELFVKRDPADFDQNDTDSENDSDPDLDDNECVDIVSSSPEQIGQEDICSNNSVNVSKFSIDNILGLKTQSEEKIDDEFCDSKCDTNRNDDPRFIKPTYSTPRTGRSII